MPKSNKIINNKSEEQIIKNDIKRFFRLIGSKDFLDFCSLSKREKIVLELTWGDLLTLDMIGKNFGVTRERIRQLYEKASNKVFDSLVHSMENQRNLKKLNQEYNKLFSENADLWIELNKFMKNDSKNIEDPIKAYTPLKNHVAEIGISIRAINCLTNANIETIQNLISHTENDLLMIQNLGQRTINNIKYQLELRGLKLK